MILFIFIQIISCFYIYNSKYKKFLSVSRVESSKDTIVLSDYSDAVQWKGSGQSNIKGPIYLMPVFDDKKTVKLGGFSKNSGRKLKIGNRKENQEDNVKFKVILGVNNEYTLQANGDVFLYIEPDTNTVVLKTNTGTACGIPSTFKLLHEIPKDILSKSEEIYPELPLNKNQTPRTISAGDISAEDDYREMKSLSIQNKENEIKMKELLEPVYKLGRKQNEVEKLLALKKNRDPLKNLDKNLILKPRNSGSLELKDKEAAPDSEKPLILSGDKNLRSMPIDDKSMHSDAFISGNSTKPEYSTAVYIDSTAQNIYNNSQAPLISDVHDSNPVNQNKSNNIEKNKSNFARKKNLNEQIENKNLHDTEIPVEKKSNYVPDTSKVETGLVEKDTNVHHSENPINKNPLAVDTTNMDEDSKPTVRNIYNMPTTNNWKKARKSEEAAPKERKSSMNSVITDITDESHKKSPEKNQILDVQSKNNGLPAVHSHDFMNSPKKNVEISHKNTSETNPQPEQKYNPSPVGDSIPAPVSVAPGNIPVYSEDKSPETPEPEHVDHHIASASVEHKSKQTVSSGNDEVYIFYKSNNNQTSNTDTDVDGNPLENYHEHAVVVPESHVHVDAVPTEKEEYDENKTQEIPSTLVPKGLVKILNKFFTEKSRHGAMDSHTYNHDHHHIVETVPIQDIISRGTEPEAGKNYHLQTETPFAHVNHGMSGNHYEKYHHIH